MDIRTKLVFAQVSVALLSMLALGYFMFGSVETVLHENTRAQLDGLAELKVEAVEQVIAGWHDRVSLVASRTQLRASLERFGRTGDAGEVERLREILEDAVGASPLFRRISVYDRDGVEVVGVTSSAGLAPAERDARAIPDVVDPDDTGSRYRGLTFREGTPPTAVFVSPLLSDGTSLGHLEAVIVTDEIVRLTGNYQGLGETGETMVVVTDAAGAVRALHPVRDAGPVAADDLGLPDIDETPPDASIAPVLGTDGPAGRALAGVEAQLVEDLIDYRGITVMAATRFIEETGWGIVVKVDEAEQRRPIDEVQSESVRVAVVFAAFAILFGTLLGYRFAQPIHSLAEAADRIRSGELATRSGVAQEDEVGLLARTFDDMAGALEDQVGLLTEFRRFFDVSLDMMCIAATDGYFKRVNPAFVRVLGWPEEELLRRPFVSMVHPDDVAATEAEILKLAGGTPTISFENRFLCMDGNYRTLRWNAYPEEETGRLYAIARVVPAGEVRDS